MTRWFVFILGIFGLLWQVGGQQNETNYDDFTLLRIFPQTEEEVQRAVSFKDPQGEVEVLKASRGLNDSLDMLVPPSRMPYVKQFLGNDSTFIMQQKENYGRSFEQLDRIPRRRVMRPNYYFNVFGYNSYEQMLEFCSIIARQNPDLVAIQPLGISYQKRQMSLVKVSSDPTAGNPIIFIDAGIHAREWVAPAMALYLIQRLVNDPEARQRDLHGIDWYIIPMVNPDGYEYTRSSKASRMWRKTRSRHGSCYGVDGNRNYGYKWAVSGVSNNPCDKETYAGPNPFSEPETRLVRDAMRQYKDRIKLYVSLHAYGQYLVYPWGYTGDLLPPTWKKLDNMARHVSDAVVNAGGSPFKVLSAGKWYAAAGGSDDYAFGAIGVPYSYTMELTNGHEFTYPVGLLKKALPQFYAGFREFGNRIRSEFGKRRRNTGRDFNNNGNGSVTPTEFKTSPTWTVVFS